MQAKTKEDKIAFLHGILLIVLFSFSAFYIAGFDFVKKLSLSPLIVGIILGMIYANTLRSALPAAWAPGIKFCSKQIPWFAFLFLLVIVVNSLLQGASFIPQDALAGFTNGINSFDTFLLTMAMTALGAETTFDKFKQAGLKPFLLAAILFLWLTVGGYYITRLIV